MQRVKTLFTVLMVGSITDRRMANKFALSGVFKLTRYFCFTLIFLIALSDPLLSGGTFGCTKKYKIHSRFASTFFCKIFDFV